MTRRSVAVFGSSEPLPDSPAYETARSLAAQLAERGLTVVNGGYGGVMEAASRGARDVGGHALGVTTSIFSARGGGNTWLSEEISEPDLFLRTRGLVDRSHGFVVLPGKSGTLAELSFLWALQRANQLGPRPVVVLDDGWERVIGLLREQEILGEDQSRGTRIAKSVEQAVELTLLGLESYERFCEGEREP